MSDRLDGEGQKISRFQQGLVEGSVPGSPTFTTPGSCRSNGSSPWFGVRERMNVSLGVPYLVWQFRSRWDEYTNQVPSWTAHVPSVPVAVLFRSLSISRFQFSSNLPHVSPPISIRLPLQSIQVQALLQSHWPHAAPSSQLWCPRWDPPTWDGSIFSDWRVTPPTLWFRVGFPSEGKKVRTCTIETKPTFLIGSTREPNEERSQGKASTFLWSWELASVGWKRWKVAKPRGNEGR